MFDKLKIIVIPTPLPEGSKLIFIDEKKGTQKTWPSGTAFQMK